MFTINLEWLAFNVNLKTVQAAIMAAAPDCCGLSANSQLEIHFPSQPSDAEIAAIKAYWESLTNESPEATTYQTSAQIAATAAANAAALIASATTKLTALGLSADEIAALRG